MTRILELIHSPLLYKFPQVLVREEDLYTKMYTRPVHNTGLVVLGGFVLHARKHS